jgi:DNA-directed RNA polymerase specialized sigma subunit
MKSYFIRIEERPVPVSRHVFKEYSRMSRRERYLREADRRVGIMLDRVLSEDGYAVGAGFFEEYQSVEDIAISRILLEQIYASLERLREQDRLIFRLLYQLDRNECETARLIGISRGDLRKKRDRIIATLRRYIRLLE